MVGQCLGPCLANFGQVRPEFGKCWPNLAQIGLQVATDGRCWAEIGRFRPNLPQSWPLWAELGPSWATIGRVSPNNEQGFSKSVIVLPAMAGKSPNWPSSAELGQAQAKACQPLPDAAQIGQSWPNWGRISVFEAIFGNLSGNVWATLDKFGARQNRRG